MFMRISRRSQDDVAAALAHGPGTHGGGGVVPRAGAHPDRPWQTQPVGDLGQQGADLLPALAQARHLGAPQATQPQHVLAPAAVADVQEQRAGRVRVVRDVLARKAEGDVVLGKHDLADGREVLGLLLAQPQQLGCGEPHVRDVAGVAGDCLPADVPVEASHLVAAAAVVPQDGGADHAVPPVQRDEPVHLPAAAHARNLAGIDALEQLGNPVAHGIPPVVGVLLAPARLRHRRGIAPAHHRADPTTLVHEQQLGRGRSNVNPNEIHDSATLRSLPGKKASAVSDAPRGTLPF